MYQYNATKIFYLNWIIRPRAAVVHLNFRAGSTFPVPVCTVPSSMDRTSRCNKVDALRLYASYRLNLLLLKGQRCVRPIDEPNKDDCEINVDMQQTTKI